MKGKNNVLSLLLLNYRPFKYLFRLSNGVSRYPPTIRPRLTIPCHVVQCSHIVHPKRSSQVMHICIEVAPRACIPPDAMHYDKSALSCWHSLRSQDIERSAVTRKGAASQAAFTQGSANRVRRLPHQVEESAL